jgi:hypothetical protein
VSASGSGPVAALGDLPQSLEEVLLARLAARALPADVRTRLDAALARGLDAADAQQRALADAAGLGLVDRGPEAVLLRHRDGAYLELRLRAGALWRVHVYEGAEARAIAERVALRASRAVEAAALRGQGASQAEATLEQRLGTLAPVGTLRRDGVEVRVGRSAIGVGVAVAVEAGTCREVRVLRDDVAERVAAALAT